MSENLQNRWEIIEGELLTKWSKDVDPNNVLPEYPRPQFRRKEWLNLNGLWDYSITSINDSKPEKDYPQAPSQQLEPVCRHPSSNLKVHLLIELLKTARHSHIPPGHCTTLLAGRRTQSIE